VTPLAEPRDRLRAPAAAVTFIEVKGRVAGSPTFLVTQNELRFAANIPDHYLLAPRRGLS
jgi:hypothetical protein